MWRLPWCKGCSVKGHESRILVFLLLLASRKSSGTISNPSESCSFFVKWNGVPKLFFEAFPKCKASLKRRSFSSCDLGRKSPHCPLLTSSQNLNFCWCCSVAQSCLTLCDPMDCSPPGSSVRGILQARILECLPCPPPGDLPDSGIELGLLLCM